MELVLVWVASQSAKVEAQGQFQSWIASLVLTEVKALDVLLLPGPEAALLSSLQNVGGEKPQESE